MRRSNLIAFALGVAASLGSVVLASQINGHNSQTTKSFRTIFAPDIFIAGGQDETADNIAFIAGEVIRGCGVPEFQMGVGDLHGITYEIEITRENIRPLQCVEAEIRSVDEAIALGFKVS